MTETSESPGKVLDSTAGVFHCIESPKTCLAEPMVQDVLGRIHLGSRKPKGISAFGSETDSWVAGFHQGRPYLARLIEPEMESAQPGGDFRPRCAEEAL